MTTDDPAAGGLRFAGLLTAAFALLTLPRLLLHELWRDEAWLWVVVTESRSLTDLLGPLARSGQGYLFPVLCFLVRQAWTSPRALQLLHLGVASAAVFVFARWAPLGRRERALFVLGYFPFYEYAVISRHYVLGVLLVWLACLAARGRRPALGLGAALGLLCQTTVYGYILALAIACGWWLDRRLRQGQVPISRPEAFAGLGLGLAGAVAGLVQLIPSSGTSFAPGWHLEWDRTRALQTLATPWRAFMPLPRPELHFWGTSLLDRWPGLEAVAGLAILGLAIALLWRSKVALATFALGATGVLAFGYVKYIGILRHHGHLWILLAAAIWLGGGLRDAWRVRAFLALLGVHLVAGAFASGMDLRYPFSTGAATAELIRREGLDRYPLFGHREPPAATVALALGRPLYSPSRRIFTTHPDWGPEQREMTAEEVRCAVRDLARREGRDVILVLTWEPPSWKELDPAGARLGAIVQTEEYRLFRLRHDRLASTGAEAGCAESGLSTDSPGLSKTSPDRPRGR